MAPRLKAALAEARALLAPDLNVDVFFLGVDDFAASTSTFSYRSAHLL